MAERQLTACPARRAPSWVMALPRGPPLLAERLRFLGGFLSFLGISDAVYAHVRLRDEDFRLLANGGDDAGLPRCQRLLPLLALAGHGVFHEERRVPAGLFPHGQTR